MASKLRRVSPAVEASIDDLASRESRTFVAQLDIVVTAGLKALGETSNTSAATTPKKTTTTKRKTATT